MTDADPPALALRQEVGTTVLVALGAYMLWLGGRHTLLFVVGYALWIIAAVLSLLGVWKVMVAVSMFLQLRRAGRSPSLSLLVPLFLAAAVLAVVVQQSFVLIRGQ